MYSRLLQFVMTKPKVVYSILLIAVITAVAMIPNLNIDTDPENMLSENAPARVFHNETKNTFAMRDMIVVGAVSNSSIFTPAHLQTLHTLSAEIEKLDGVIVDDLLSLSAVDNIRQEEGGGIRFEYLMKEAPTSQAASNEIQGFVKRLPMLDNTLVSGDDLAIAIYVPIESKDLSYQIAEQVRAITASINSDLDFHITGLPVAEDQFGVEMFIQMGVAAPMAGAAIFFLLWYFFRNIPLIIAPMVVAMATVLIIMGSLIGMGFTVHIMSSMIAIFLMPIAVVDSVHVLSEFADNYKKDDDPKTVVTQVMKHLYTPMLFTSITSAIGFYSLLLTPIPPVKVFGAFIGTGILLAFFITITYLPAYISRLSPANLAKLQEAVTRMEQKGLLSNALEKLGKFARSKVVAIILVFLTLLAVSIQGITKIEINDNPVNWFKSNHEIRVADSVLNEHFAGTYDAWLVLQAPPADNKQTFAAFNQALIALNEHGVDTTAIQNQFEADNKQFSQSLLVAIDDLAFEVEDEQADQVTALYDLVEAEMSKNKLFLNPAMLNWMGQLQNELVATGLIGKANGLSDIVKTVNRELNSGEQKDFVIPNSSDAVAQTLLQYQSSHRPQDLWHFVTTDYQQSLLWLQMTSGDNQHTTKVVAWVEGYIANNPAPMAIEYDWAGKSYLNIVWQDAMVSGMMESLLSSFVIVFIMMVLLFRSLKYGLLAMMPLTFTITMIYGLIGWFGKAYDMPIAVLSALTLGLSVDFAIHFLQRARELERETGSLTQALILMFEEPSKAISRNAIVIAIGFTPLLLSPLVPYITVGFFLASIMALSALVTLVLLPALLVVTQGKKRADISNTL
ncbi:efflux RND transporter permease subunit [Thalassotalea agarivorans]|uniref:SSD domain-containing protein n=1 Tax=Thalassotalea agarivorans TaxID=349064 RepID=A0A1I0AV97_THASX|nr:MMPL family transporter [Thalassotalea agarivorans]SES98291.1 hypothetical protein SAMN05660429_00829 [Thalassotalea agarivorans]